MPGRQAKPAESGVKTWKWYISKTSLQKPIWGKWNGHSVFNSERRTKDARKRVQPPPDKPGISPTAHALCARVVDSSFSSSWIKTKLCALVAPLIYVDSQANRPHLTLSSYGRSRSLRLHSLWTTLGPIFVFSNFLLISLELKSKWRIVQIICSQTSAADLYKHGSTTSILVGED